MVTSALLTVLLLSMALWRKGFGWVVWIDLIISAANAAVFLGQIFS